MDRSKTKSQKPYIKGPASSHRAETRQATPSSSLWKERQERDFRKANGLCFYCGDKFDASHIEKCTKRPKPQVNALVLNNLDTNLTDEVLDQLAVEDALNEEFCQLSLHALAGTENTNCIKLRALVKNKVMLTLMDSGSSHSFVDSSFLEKVGITAVPTLPKKVKLANGQVVISDKVVPQLSWWCQGHTITSEMRVLDLGAYDAILGYDWLQPHSPMSCHWEARTISFMHNGKSVTLQGVQPPEAQVTAVSSDTLLKWTKGNDIWAYALVDYVPADTAPAPPPAIQQLLSKYQDVFAAPHTLPPSRRYDHTIPLIPGAVPVNARPYRYSPAHKDEIEKQVRQLLESGLITHSNSPFASPVLLVQKKDGTWRFCVDYRRLNALTIKDRFPMPVIQEILDELFGSKFFTKLDMRSGYHQVRMLLEDEHKTAFKTHQGHYQFRVMPFGLTNALATFQYIMNDILSPFLRKFVLVFLDDILIYSPTMEDHVMHVQQVLDKLREHHLYLKASKCSFAQDTLEYLGHIISGAGVSTDSSKTEAMLQWPRPTNVTELRGFLGLTGYYRRFVKNYGTLAKPLTQLLKQKQFH